MATHLDDEEELQKIKTWWKENWLALVGGLVIGFGAIGGWEGYKNWKNARAEAASQLYVDLSVHLRSGEMEQSEAIVSTLKAEYSGTPYAAAGALALAGAQVEAADLDQAVSSLGWVIDNADDDGMVEAARLRKARLLFAQQKHDEALGLLKSGANGFASLYSELRGDIQLAKGDRDAARTAYEEALSQAEVDARNRNLLQQKLDDLAVGAAS